MPNELNKFATSVLKEKMDSLGYKRKKNGWYKVMPDVILCVEMQKLGFHAFRINYGIVPLSCYLYFNLELATYETEQVNWQKNKEKYRLQFNLPYNLDNQNHFWCPDSTSYSLRDPKEYPFYFAFWTDAVNELILPALLPIHDLNSASEMIEQLWISEKSQYEYYAYAPMFIKMGEYEKASNCLASYINHWTPDGISNNNYIQMKAEEAWKAWKTKGTHIKSPFLWQWLIQTNDHERLDELIDANETAALAWIKKNGLGVEGARLTIKSQDPNRGV